MKQKIVYGIALVIFASAIGLIWLKYQREQKMDQQDLAGILPRKGSVLQAEWAICRTTSEALFRKIKANPSDSKSLLALSALYLQEARSSGNYSYYDRAALHCVNLVLKKDVNNFEALTFKSMILLSQHHFADGLQVATRVANMYPYNAFIYGILTDANVEMGNYKAALEAAGKMISIRPDIRSYSRISYLREIHGDISGAVEAMKMAVEAGAAGTENTEWARVQLGKLYEQSGQMQWAAMQYTMAMDNRPAYAPALAGMARVAVAGSDYNKAIHIYLQADSNSNDYSFRESLAELYQLTGDQSSSRQIGETIIREMENAAKASQRNDSAGHYADREMAYAYLAVNNYDKALEHALLEYNRRPDNIDANEILAWCYYYKKDFQAASTYIKQALRTNCKNPLLLCRAGLIFAKAGDRISAKNCLQDALRGNPSLSMTIKTEAASIYKSLL